jgi:hypothetical protein
MRGYVIENASLFADEDSDDLTLAARAKVRREIVDKLAAEWNELNSELERRSWHSQEYIDSEADYFAERCEDYIREKIPYLLEVDKTLGFSKEDYENYLENLYRSFRAPKIAIPEEASSKIAELQQKLKGEFDNQRRMEQSKDAARLEIIEQMLGFHGVRMMRPYEHWNEEEDRIQYLENRYDDERYW